eukprot:2310048-Rhodomonas_salina.1
MSRAGSAQKSELDLEKEDSAQETQMARLVSVNFDRCDSQTANPAPDEKDESEEEEEAPPGSRAASGAAPSGIQRCTSSEVVQDNTGRKVKTLEVAEMVPAKSRQGHRRQRRVSITITEEVIDPEDVLPRKEGEDEHANMRSQKRRSRRQSVISVNELDVLDKMLMQE